MTILIASNGNSYNIRFAGLASEFEDPAIFRVTLNDGTIIKPENDIYGEILAVQTAHYLASSTPSSLLSQGIDLARSLQIVSQSRADDINDTLPFLAASGIAKIFLNLGGPLVSYGVNPISVGVGLGTALAGAISSQIEIKTTNGASAAYEGLFKNLGVALESSIATLSTNIAMLDDGEIRSIDVLNAWLSVVDATVTTPAAMRLLTDFESNLDGAIPGIDSPLDAYLDTLGGISNFARNAFFDVQILQVSQSLAGQLAPLGDAAILRRQAFIEMFGEVALDSGLFSSQFGEIVKQAETRFIDQLAQNGRILSILDNFTNFLTVLDVAAAGFDLFTAEQQLSALRDLISNTGQAIDQLVGESRFAAAFATRESRLDFEIRAAALPVLGTIGSDRILASSGPDRIFADDGNDEISAGDGDDMVVGGAGSDIIKGGNGDDLILPGEGIDQVDGEAGGDIYRGRLQDLNGDSLAFEFGDRVELFGATSQLPSFGTDSIAVIGNRVSIDFDHDGTEDFFFVSEIGAIGRPVVIGETVTDGIRTVIIQAGDEAAFVINQPLTSGLSSADQAMLGGMTAAGETFSIGLTNIHDGPSDPELRNLAVTDTGSVFTVFEYDAGENLSFGLENALPPQFPGDVGGVIVELDPETGAFIDSTIRAFAFGSGGSVPNTPPDFGVTSVESINALAPLGGGEFLAIAEFNFRTSDPIRTLEGGSDFAFKIDTSGNTDFLVNWSVFGDGDGTRTIAADTSPITGQVYAWRDFSNSYGGGSLLEVDRDSGEPTVVASFGVYEITSIAFQSDGTLIGIGGDEFGRGTIFEIDPVGRTIVPVQFITGEFFPREFDLFGDFQFKPETNGTSDDDSLEGSEGDDYINGGLGNDSLSGFGGNDDIFAGGGTDVINPGLGSDVVDIFGSRSDVRGTLSELDGDRIRGFSHDDTLTFLGASFSLSSISLSLGSLVYPSMQIVTALSIR
ncbi:MAG: hypothetical protein H6945_10000 [Zoogloeaceae bacterium]|nr:hypothetical protein [Zoogloeaceae bacterium]